MTRIQFLLNFSEKSYAVLLRAYTLQHRMAFSTDMRQTFTDLGRETYKTHGLPGLTGLWVKTLLDLLKTALEDRLQETAQLKNGKLIRLSGWAMLAGALALTTGFFYIDSTTIYVGLMRILGPPETLIGYNLYSEISDNAGGWIAFAGVLLLIAGTSGLRLRYQDFVGVVGSLGLNISIISSCLTAGGMIGYQLSGWTGWWPFFSIALNVQFAGLALFGAAALRKRTLPRWNASPLMAGAGWPLATAAYLISRGFGDFLEMPLLVMNSVWLLSLAGFALLAYVLQGDVSHEQAVK